jgi:hypothetical protein
MLRTLALLLFIATFSVQKDDARADEANSVETEFTIDVMPVLSKAGCNLGTCHGNLNGKGGLKLSLRGQDPEHDFQVLARNLTRPR